MGRQPRREHSPRTEQVRAKIEEWRRTRTRRTRMPEPLWAAAVAVAREHGVYAASRDLGVRYESLRARVETSRGKSASSKRPATPTFVEIGGALPFAGGPTGSSVEVTASDGAKLAIRLGGGETLDVVGLVREFWSRGV